MTARIGFWQFVAIFIAIGPLAVAKDKAQPASSPDAPLVMGETYTIRVERHGARKKFHGELTKVNHQWLVLHHISTGSDESVRQLAKSPIIGRWFRAAIEMPADEFIWIPRDAAYIESHTAAKSPPPNSPPSGDNPAEQVSCTVEFAKGNHIERRDGGMESVGEKGLTLNVPKQIDVEQSMGGFGLGTLAGGRKETRYSRQLISHSDVMCVRVGNFNPTILTIGSR